MLVQENKNVLITGGSGGIGKSISKGFLEAGARVLLVSRTQEELEKAKKELLEVSDKVEILAADVSDLSEIKKIELFIQEHLGGRVDILINAAGIYGPMGALDTLTDEEMKHWVKTYEVNLFGTVYMCRMVIPIMKKLGSGRIINFSGGGDGPFPNFTAYSSSKASVLRFTESVAAELKEFNITVNAIAPGAVNSGLLDQVLAAGEERVGKNFYEQSLKQKDDGGTPPEITAVFLLDLCTEKTDNLTGRFLSAKWDDLELISKHVEEIMGSDLYVLRRIKPEDRGFNW